MITAMGAIRPRCSTTRTARSAVFQIPTFVINDASGIAIDEACEVKPTWNAAVCKGDVGRLNIGAAGAGGRGGRGAAGAAVLAAVPVVEAQSLRAGGPGARGAARGGFGARGVLTLAPAQPPVVLSRNGKDFPVTGATNVRAGTDYQGNHRKAVPEPQRVGIG